MSEKLRECPIKMKNMLGNIFQQAELIEKLDWSDDGMTEAQICAGEIKHLVVESQKLLTTEDALRNELADRLAYECARQIVAGRIGTRSGIGDTLLRYLKIGQPGECDSVPEWMRKYEDLTTPQDGA